MAYRAETSCCIFDNFHMGPKNVIRVKPIKRMTDYHKYRFTSENSYNEWVPDYIYVIVIPNETRNIIIRHGSSLKTM